MKITTIFNECLDVPCIGCIVNDSSKFMQGRIYQTKLWDVSQDFEIAYPGLVVISPMRHILNYSDLTDQELKELRELTIKTKIALVGLFGCKRFGYMFFERDGGHLHFIIVPFHGLISVNNKYSVIAELLARADELKRDEQNMERVISTINKLKNLF